MLIRKLRIDKGWSQETLAEVSGLSVRTIQRLERGDKASLETLTALAAVFEVDVPTLSTEAPMYTPNELSKEERRAIRYVRDLKAFYSHAATYAVVIFGLFIINLFTGISTPWFIWPMLGWGVGVAAHGLSVFEVMSLFSPDWEKREIEKRLERTRRD
ncbi:MAG: 2TM domain-containing protein [Alphaproteobacteria bacterium]|uniref:2TM domain-containing protein n=1 Tax=Pyruvatibacter sp. HU-CL02332 TaxID=3127650 RepID=UPI00296A5D36|nr:2TM domain-containing protein [Alphaproteobacteria bacterium]